MEKIQRLTIDKEGVAMQYSKDSISAVMREDILGLLKYCHVGQTQGQKVDDHFSNSGLQA